MTAGVLEPGDSDVLTVNFRAIPGRSAYRSSVSIITDEQGACRYEIPVVAKVTQEYDLDPETLDFGKIPRKGEAKREIRIRRSDGAPFAIKEILPVRPDLTWGWKPLEISGSPGYQIEGTARGLQAGFHAASAKIVTGSSPETGVPLQFSFDVESSFSCTPAPLSAARAPDGRGETFETVIRAAENQDVVVESIREAKGVALEYDAHPLKQGECQVTIRLTGPVPPNRPLGSFLIKLKGEDQPLALPYRFDPEEPPGK